MVATGIVTVSLLIMVNDYRSHLIANRANLLLLLLLLCDLHTADFHATLLVLIGICTLFPLLGIGVGDVKLALILISTEGRLVISSTYLLYLLLCLTLTLIAAWVEYRSFKVSYPFSQVLLAPFIASYLVI